MIVDTLTKDLGDIKIGVPHSFTFVLTAEDYPVTFNRISAGCSSCTVANIDKSAISANETVDFKVTFTPGVMGEALKKEFTFTATVIA
jgi:hypothetical protein